MAESPATIDWPEPDDELYWLLRALAIERDELYRQLGAARGEADRLRVALRRWQGQHNRCLRAPQGSPQRATCVELTTTNAP